MDVFVQRDITLFYFMTICQPKNIYLSYVVYF